MQMMSIWIIYIKWNENLNTGKLNIQFMINFRFFMQKCFKNIPKILKNTEKSEKYSEDFEKYVKFGHPSTYPPIH